MIVFLTDKIKAQKEERMPLEERRLELEKLIEQAYVELQDDFQFRRYLELKESDYQAKMRVLIRDIKERESLLE